MPRHLILHIGTSKTGSTAIQKILSGQREELVRQGTAYPRSPGNERHGLLATAATTDRKRVDNAEKNAWKGATPAEKLAKFRAEFDAEMRALPPDVRQVIISAEQFSMMLLDRQGVQNLHDMLAPHFDTAQVVVYLRRPDQHFTSLYSQMLRWGDAQLPGLLKAKIPAAHGYDYDGLLDRWASVFGETSLNPRLFEGVLGKRFDVVQDFLALCGLDLEIKPEEGSTANQAFSHPAQMILVELSQYVMGDKIMNVTSPLWLNLTEAVAAAVPGQSWQPTQAEAKAFVARYAENHERVRQRWFPQRASLFSTDFSQLPFKPQHVDDTAMLKACVRTILELGNRTVKLEDRLAAQAASFAEESGDTHKLQKSLAKRIYVNGNNVEARLKLARLLVKTGDEAGALRQAQAILQIHPRNADALAIATNLQAASSTAGSD